ncbi:MAG: LacI family transcriptional regulator [Actinomycetia bacterium]|nr:LacI family transcriptional regulator [Actinomycetes bacterium]
MRRGRVTIAEVAERAGVSLTTVSHVLSARRPVAPGTRQRVLEIIDELGYEPDSAAAGLAGARSTTIALDAFGGTSWALSQLVEPESYFYIGLLRAIEAHATAAGHDLLMPSRPQDDAGGYLRRLRSRRAAGVVVMARNFDDPRTRALLEAQFPTVFVDMFGRGPKATSVTSDNADGARQATEHLLALGHRRIARISKAADPMAGQGRNTGARAALSAAGVLEDPRLVLEAEWTPDAAYQATVRLLRSGAPFTAVLAGSDVMAINVIAALADHGLRVPEDVSVVGFDDLQLGTMVRPTLTTVRQDTDAMGAAVIEALRRILDGEPAPEPILVPTALVVRGSTAAPRP